MRNFLLTLSMSLIATLAFSQAQIEAGVKAGANYSTLNQKGVKNIKGVFGYHVGVYGVLKPSEKFGVQSELVYSTQGAKIEGEKINLGYLNMPLLGKYYLPSGLNIFAGPQVGFLISKKIPKSSVERTFKSTDFAGVVGVGWDAPTGLNISARYNYGFSDINKKAGVAKMGNRFFQLSVGYTL